jgi:hypothetical protein
VRREAEHAFEISLSIERSLGEVLEVDWHAAYTGCYWYMAIPNMREERLSIIMQAYADILREHDFLRDIFGVI